MCTTSNNHSTPFPNKKWGHNPLVGCNMVWELLHVAYEMGRMPFYSTASWLWHILDPLRMMQWISKVRNLRTLLYHNSQIKFLLIAILKAKRTHGDLFFEKVIFDVGSTTSHGKHLIQQCSFWYVIIVQYLTIGAYCIYIAQNDTYLHIQWNNEHC